MKPDPFNVAVIIPTGVGASMGGFGGDAMSLLPLFASIADTLITHPNVANAACFQNLPANALYVEGYALDQFFKGQWGLTPVRNNRVGVIWDSGAEPAMRTLHQNTIAAVQTVYGVDIVGIEDTSKPVAITLTQEASGRSAGRIENPEVLIQAGEKLIAQGATALGICCVMPELANSKANDTYKSGEGVDPIGGVEAMISHALVAEFKIPCAHAPVFSWEDAHPVLDRLIDPRSAAEFIAPTFLPCVLTGLAKAPQFSLQPTPQNSIDALSALVIPADCLGGVPVLACIEKNSPVIAVAQNKTVMGATAQALGLEKHVIPAHSYLEALGHLVALKQGITLPQHIKP